MNRDKTLAVKLLKGFSIGVMLIFSFLITMYTINVGVNLPVLSILSFGVFTLLFSLYLISKEKYTIAKYVISLVPPYALIIASLITKSEGVFSNVFTYLTPRFFVSLYLMAPIMFFGLKQKKHLINSLIILSPIVLFFDYLHNAIGVRLENLEFIYVFYPIFIGMTTVFLLFVYVGILLNQRTNILFREKIKSQNLLIQEEKNEIESLNEQLKFQSNLYSILNITSVNKHLIFILQDVLDQILKLDCLQIEKKGLIFLTNNKGDLEISAHRNVNTLISTCSIIRPGECLCGQVLQNKTKLYCNSIGHEHTIKPNDMMPHGHYVIPIKKNEKVLGVINIYIKQGEARNENVEKFLENVAIILARKISSERNKEQLMQRNIDFKNQGNQLKSILQELNESITYAQFLQKSLIPNQATINNYFEESSFLFKPRDKVSGDFYFAHEVNDSLFFGVGDCTGHGIPGGFLAAMSIEAVKTVILTNENKMPNDILNKLREIAKERFSVNLNDKRSDAMDAAICMYNKKDDKLYYSGGFVNLLIVRNNSEIIITPATKCPIGSYPVEYDFELHEIDLQKGDVIYLSSDGYVDQFGYDKTSKRTKSTKFKRKRFRELLISISHLSCDEQVKILKSNLLEWRGDIEQIDDITVFIAKH